MRSRREEGVSRRWPLCFVAVCITAAVLLGGSARAQESQAAAHPPIAINFDLKEPGFVTLVIEDSQGRRVRNLISETPFAAGPQTVWWDGMDESGIVRDPRATFCYDVHGKAVTPGEYHVRGLVRKAVDLRYEFSVYSPGNPPWFTEDRTGGWLADHTPPSDVLYLPKSPVSGKPQLLVCAKVAENGYSLMWLDLEGNKLYGQLHGRGGHALARDPGPQPSANYYAYGVWLKEGLEIYGLTNDNDQKAIATYDQGVYATAGGKGDMDKAATENYSIAAYNGTVVVSLPAVNKLLFVPPGAAKAGGKVKKATAGKGTLTVDLPATTGLCVDDSGALYVLSQKQLKKYSVDWNACRLGESRTLVASGLDDPRRLAIDSQGNLYVSDWGQSNQVKVFDRDGKPLRVIGKPGGLLSGSYDRERMTHPQGMAITPDGRLWVAEYSTTPKRLSDWTIEGKFITAFYGPACYGGAGTLDPADPTRLFYASRAGGMEFKLDWQRGTSDLAAIFIRIDENALQLCDKNDRPRCPERPLHAGERTYWTNCFDPVFDMANEAGIWQTRGNNARLVAAVGTLHHSRDFESFLIAHKDDKTLHLPPGIKMDVDGNQKLRFFTGGRGDGPKQGADVFVAWSDLNDNGQLDANEFSFIPTPKQRSAITVDDRLTFLTAAGLCLKPQGFTKLGAPIYDATKAVQMVPGGIEQHPMGRQAILGQDGWVVATGGPIEGFKDGKKMWYYHSQWPSGFSKGKSPLPQYPGQLLDTMRLAGPVVTPRNSDAGDIWAICGDYGQMFLLTTDGLYVATLFKDARTVDPYLPIPAKRGLLLNDVTLLGECYGPTITQVPDGKIYVQAGKARCTLTRVDGLDSIRRLDAGQVTVTLDQLKAAAAWRDEEDSRKHAEAAEAAKPFLVPVVTDAPKLDGSLDDWKDSCWVAIDAKDPKKRASLKICGDHLYAAYEVEFPLKLENNPDDLNTLFKGGSALDLFLGTDGSADPKRRQPVPGDLRLLVTNIKGKPTAVVYQAVVPGTKEPAKYESPIGTATIDRVTDVSSQLKIASGTRSYQKKVIGGELTVNCTEFEFSIPLAALGLQNLAPGQSFSGDIGLLLGRPGITSDRRYWSNKSSSMTNDLPTEARFTPDRWGTLHIATPAEVAASNVAEAAEKAKKKKK